MSFSEIIPPYQVIADEYYDKDRHQTCANFGELSCLFLYERLRKLAITAKNALEVGAGRSILAQVLEDTHLPLSRVTILDQSSGMLKHSKRWIEAGAVPIIADARHTGLRDSTFDLIVSSLGDPYDSPNFWLEMRRIIDDNGVFLFTTPSFEWSSRFRAASERDKAEFSLRGGRSILAPSFTRPIAEELTLIIASGFEIVEEFMPTKDAIIGPHSSKLNVIRKAPQGPVLYCFVLRTRGKQ